MAYHGGELAPLFREEFAELAMREMADDGGDAMHRHVVELTPVYYSKFPGAGQLVFGLGERSRPPGTLKRSWYRLPVNKTLRRGLPAYEAVTATNDPVAPFVEWDTRPHIIRPKRPGGQLRFRVWPTGEMVTASIVHHPGTTGQHPMLRAGEAVRAEFGAITRPAAVRWAKRQARAATNASRGA